MIDYRTIRLQLVRYVWDAIHIAGVEKSPSKETCSSMVDRMVDIILAANEGIVEHILTKVNNSPSGKQARNWAGWKSKLRKAVSTYMTALYHELDAADAFIKDPTSLLACELVSLNSDCMIRAVPKARIIAKKRRKLYGFLFFWRDAA